MRVHVHDRDIQYMRRLWQIITYFCVFYVVIFTARRYASGLYAVIICPSVCHKSVFYKDGYTEDRKDNALR